MGKLLGLFDLVNVSSFLVICFLAEAAFVYVYLGLEVIVFNQSNIGLNSYYLFSPLFFHLYLSDQTVLNSVS